MKTQLEKTVKRGDGTRVRIKVAFISDFSYSGYSVYVTHCNKGKRTWKSCCNVNSHTYSILSMEERRAAIEKAQLDYVTEQEIYDAKIELWLSMKPKTNI